MAGGAAVAAVGAVAVEAGPGLSAAAAVFAGTGGTPGEGKQEVSKVHVKVSKVCCNSSTRLLRCSFPSCCLSAPGKRRMHCWILRVLGDGRRGKRLLYGSSFGNSSAGCANNLSKTPTKELTFAVRATKHQRPVSYKYISQQPLSARYKTG